MTDLPEDVIATVSPSAPRSLFSVTVLGVLGLLLLWIAVSTPPAHPGWLIVLIGLGALALYGAYLTWRLGQDRLILTRDVLKTASGREICRVADIKSVERGVMAFKPSGGFLLRLHRKQPRAWAPGLWWRFGRSVGVGGVTRAGEARAMADILSALRSELA